MKYIHIVQFHLLSGGGVGSLLTELCGAMVREGADTYVISLFQHKGLDYEQEKTWAKENGVHIELLQKDGKEPVWKVLFRLRKRIATIAQKEDCCLFLHLKWGVLSGIVSSIWLHHVKRVEVYHSGYLRYKLQAFLSRPFIKHYIAVSNDAARQLKEWFHIREAKISVVYNGADLSKIRIQAKNIQDDFDSGIHFTSVGRLSFEKGFKTPIEAYANLRQEGQMEDTSYTVIGDGVQKEECLRLGQGKVLFTGLLKREEVFQRIAASDVIILPSLWEGNSMLMLEVIALGKPMIVTDIPAFREVLGFSPLMDHELWRKEWFGIVFRKEDVQSCAVAMVQMLQSQEEYPEMSRRVYALADCFSSTKQAKRYIEIANRC